MKIDGRLSVNGQPGTYLSGGGSGGSLYFLAGHFDGSGLVQVSLGRCSQVYFLTEYLNGSGLIQVSLSRCSQSLLPDILMVLVRLRSALVVALRYTS